ncbi:hypothetical protein [Marisediminicola senii]|uniref:hypothetical protein n=1 Tax=Marisediminicola senii TaxID=2711233 RepID=UPI0013EDE625|nr:hypothetical protein [Marisediminicola senii]
MHGWLTEQVAEPPTCGHSGRAVGVIDGNRYCDNCWRNAPETRRQCVRCDVLDHLNRAALCKACRATDAIHNLFTGPVLTRRPELVPIRDHFLAADPKYLLQLIKAKNAWRVLTTVVGLPHSARHEDLDSLGTARAVSQVRSLLIELGVLPQRDEYLAQLEAWTAQAIACLPNRSDQLAIRQFTRWRQQHRRQRKPMAHTDAANDRRELRLVLSLIAALNHAGGTMDTARQQHLDSWAANAPADAFRVRHFLRWRAQSGKNTSLIPPAYQRAEFRIGGNVGSNEHALRQLTTNASPDPRLSLAVLLTVVYGIRVHRIAALRVENFTIRDGTAQVRLGSVALELPNVAAPWIEAIQQGVPLKRRFGGSSERSEWVFPGYRHGNHVLASSLAVQLRDAGVSPALAHQVSAAVIITQVPPAVVARILGIHLTTAAQWHQLAGSIPLHHQRPRDFP